MDNRKNIDDFFKKKLEGETFDFDEKYWAGAESLLDEDKSNRRGAFWWWSMNGLLGLGLLIAVLGLGTFWYVNHTSNDAIAETARSSETTLQNSNESNTTTSEITNTNTNTTSKNNQSTKADNTNQSQKAIPQNNQTQNTLKSTKNETVVSTNANKKSSTPATRSITNIIGKVAQVMSNDDEVIRGTAGDSSPNIGSLLNPIDNGNSGAIGTSTTTNTNNKTTNTPNGIADAQPERPIAELSFNSLDSDKGGLLTSEIAKELPQRMVVLMFGREKELPSLKPIERVLTKRWQFGIEAGVAANNNLLTFPQYQAGLFAQYRLNEKLYLKSGARFVQQEVGATFQDSTQIGYGFGNEDVEYRYKDNAAQYIEIPLTLGYTLGKHSFEGGIGLRKLLAVQSELYESKHVLPSDRTGAENMKFELDILVPYYEDDGNAPFSNPPVYTEETLVQTGTRTGAAYNSTLINAHFAYYYRLNLRLDLGLNLNYRFGTIDNIDSVGGNAIGNTSIGLSTCFKF